MKQVPPLALTGLLLLQLVMPVPILKGPVTDTAGLPKVNDAAVLLVRVIWVRLLVVPTGCGAKVTELGLRATELVPVPVIPTICGLLRSLSLMISAPFFAPVVFGLKTTLMVQFAPATKVLPDVQWLAAMAKSVSFRVTVPMVTVAVPLLVTVTVLGGLVVFTAWLPKSNGPVTEMALPVPSKLMVVVPLKKPLSSMVIVPVSGPAAVGLKRTYMAQAAALDRLVPQLSYSVKGPLIEILLKVSEPRALSVKTCGVPVEPTVTSPKSRLLAEVFSAVKTEIPRMRRLDRKSTRLNSSHLGISYAVFCLKKKK